MKNISFVIMVTMFSLSLIFSIMFGIKKFNESSSEIIIVSPKLGIECAKLVTSNGVALDCWKVK